MLKHVNEHYNIEIITLENGLQSIRVCSQSQYVHRKEWVTRYDDSVIEKILCAKGPAFLLDELAREEDPNYIKPHIEATIACHIDPKELTGLRLLDFGCGCGASTVILSRFLPNTHITGIELNKKNLDAARARSNFYRLNIDFQLSPSKNRLPKDIGPFNVIMLSAVYEHLLPEERALLLKKLWSILTPNGLLFIDETPWRWFPFETHTTGLPFLNYLPNFLALRIAPLSQRILPTTSWPELLRAGVRGATVKEILAHAPGKLIRPTIGARDYVDVWKLGYARSSKIKARLALFLKLISVVTGISIVPYLSLAIRKTE